MKFQKFLLSVIAKKDHAVFVNYAPFRLFV